MTYTWTATRSDSTSAVSNCHPGSFDDALTAALDAGKDFHRQIGEHGMIPAPFSIRIDNEQVGTVYIGTFDGYRLSMRFFRP